MTESLGSITELLSWVGLSAGLLVGILWLVGRLMAECAFCATALPMLDGGTTGIGLFRGLHREHQLAA